MTRAFSLFSNHKRTFFALAFLSAFSLTIVYAAPRTESYAPGDTLDPECAPGEDFCSVEIPTGATSPITIENTTSLFSTGLTGTGVGSDAQHAIFLGEDAGGGATGASFSNFIGVSAGLNAAIAYNSNFIGGNAGNGASGTSYSNFIGASTGSFASTTIAANFIGYYAGYGSSNAGRSNFFGQYTGKNTSNASYSTLIGYNVGNEESTGIHIGSNNIIIGTNISLPNATANAINIGGVLFGTGTYSTTIGDPSITPVSGGRIGIGVVSPSYTLQVGNSGVSGIVARFENSAGTCDINPTSASLSCSSDETLKKDIIAVDDDMLEKILSLQPVTYHWKSEDESSDTHIGFIAQQVEEVFPDLVTTDRQTGLKSLNYTGLIPYTVKAVQEMDVQMQTIADIDTPNSLRESLVAWLGSVTNGIENIFSTKITTKEFCVQDDAGETCLTRTQINELLGGQSNENSSTDEPVPDPIVETPVDDQTLPEEFSPEPVVDEPAPDTTTPAE